MTPTRWWAMLLAACAGCVGEPPLNDRDDAAGDAGVSRTGAESPPARIYWYDDDDNVMGESDYVIEDGEVIVEGDLNLGDVDLVLASDAEIRANPDTMLKPHWNTRWRRRWEDGVIRLEISGHFSPRKRATILEAVALWDAMTEITGILWDGPRNGKPHHETTFFDASSGGCNSVVGRHARRGEINLGGDCCETGINPPRLCAPANRRTFSV